MSRAELDSAKSQKMHAGLAIVRFNFVNAFAAKHGRQGGSHSINWCRLRCTIMSCTLCMVLSRRLVSVALV